MKRTILHPAFALLCLLCATACSDDEKSLTPPATEPPTPEPPVAAFTPLPDYTVAGNQLNAGLAAADSAYLYYRTDDTPAGMTLYSRHKATGKVTPLDRNEQEKEGTDCMFQNLHARDGYLYYYTSDPKKGRNAFFRVKADGSAEPERLTENGYYDIVYTDECIYLHDRLSPHSVKQIDYQRGSERLLFDKRTFACPVRHDGRFYYTAYEGTYDEGTFHPVLRTCDLTGGDDRKIHDFRVMGKFVIADGRIYMHDRTPNAPGPEVQPGLDYVVSSISPEGGEETVLMKDLPTTTGLNSYGNLLFVCIHDSKVATQNGLYVYKTDENRHTQIIKERPIQFVSIVGDNQLVFSDCPATTSHTGKLYLTNFAATDIAELK